MNQSYKIVPILIAILVHLTKVNYAQKSNNDSVFIKKQMRINEDVKNETLKTLKEDVKNNLTKLTSEFYLKKITGSSNGWYHHKNIPDSAKCYIQTPVSAKGNIYLKAHYIGKELYTINRITVQVVSATYYSQPLAINSNYIFRKKIGSLKCEVLHLFIYKTKEGWDTRNISCIMAIASAKENENVLVTFYGIKENYEFVLTKENIKSIKDSYNLSQYLSFKNNKYETITSSFLMINNPKTVLVPKDPFTKEDMRGIQKF